MREYVSAGWNAVVTAIKGSLWVAGLLLAGSDGSFMPLANISGLVIFAAASILIARQPAVNDRAVEERNSREEDAGRGVPQKAGRQEKGTAMAVPATSP